MPVRRAAGSVLGGTSDLIRKIVEMQIGNQFTEASQARQADYALTKQNEAGDASLRRSVISDSLNHPEIAQRIRANNTQIPGYDPSQYIPTQSETAAPLYGEVGKATEDTPWEVIAGTAQSRGLTDPVALDKLHTAFNARMGAVKQSALDKFNANEHYDPTVGAPVRVGPGGVVQQTAPTAQQAGENKLTEFKVGEGSPGYAEAKANAEAIVNRITAPSAAAKAAQVAGATTRANLAPDIVNMEVDKERRMQEVKTQGAYKTTDTQRRSATNIPGLFNADGLARDLESQGVKLNSVSQFQQSNPMLGTATGAVTGPLRVLSFGKVDWNPTPEEKRYTQAATDFTNTFAYIRSGVTVRQDETPRFLATYFAVPSDDAGMLKQKQNARSIFLSAAAIQAGGSAQEAGQVIGEAIRNKEIDPKMLELWHFPKDMEAAIMQSAGIRVAGPGGR